MITDDLYHFKKLVLNFLRESALRMQRGIPFHIDDPEYENVLRDSSDLGLGM